MLKEHVEDLSKLQQLHYASNRYAMLLIFQGMDAAGKDGIIRHVMSGINPQGCEVYSFKQPSTLESEHDFLWRTNIRLPERGKIGIFNRSYYEEVIVVRVHPEYLFRQGFSKKEIGEKNFWKHRYESMINWEKHLYHNNTRVIKFFLHLSKEEQRKRLLLRLEDPDKNWKVNPGDIHERGYWSDYTSAYENCITATSTREAPWYMVPADDKQNARLIVSKIVLEAFSDLKLKYPSIDETRRKELKEIHKDLTR